MIFPEDDYIIKNIKKVLNRLYLEDYELFKRRMHRGVCERCLTFRLALYLQDIFRDYFVDCDFNSAYFSYIDKGKQIINETPGKFIKNKDGRFKSRFIDIIIHKRSSDPTSNFLCFEIKKWNNYANTEKDINNLKELTGEEWNYRLGFFIVLHENLEKTKLRIFKKGQEILD